MNLSMCVALGALGAMSGCAAQAPKKPAAPDEIHQLDFWLGDFDVTMHQRGGVARSHNVAIFNDRVIEENFFYPDGHVGLSWSVYVAKQDQWRQIWVDSRGSFLQFVGGQDDEGQMKLTLDVPAGTPKVQKMVFSNITEEGHEWRYYSSTDGGEHWTETFHTTFERLHFRELVESKDIPVNPESPCISDEAGQFDFWIGDWDLDWANGKGTNSIDRILGDCVIRENFAGAGGFAGGSLSMWRPKEKQWRQIWMDNQGTHLSFAGGWDGEQMVLVSEPPAGAPNGRASRMRWHDIEDDSFVWTYEGSGDDGATWKTIWEINYTRRR